MRPDADRGQGQPLEASLIPCMGWESVPLPHHHRSHGWMAVPSPSQWSLKDRNITVSTIYPSVRMGGVMGSVGNKGRVTQMSEDMESGFRV